MAGVIKGIGKFLIGGVAGLIGGKSKKKAAQVKSPLPVANRDDAAAAAADEEALRRRRGASADILTGRAGAEAALGQTAKFIPGS